MHGFRKVKSFWEMSCDAQVTSKANSDYKKRTDKTPEQSERQVHSLSSLEEMAPKGTVAGRPDRQYRSGIKSERTTPTTLNNGWSRRLP